MSRIVVMLWLAAATLLSSEAAMADVKKWVDPDGGVHYGDNPPSGADTTPVDVRPNVIETDWSRLRTVNDKSPAQPKLPAVQTATESRKDLQSYVEQCRKNRGVDCELEA